MSIRVRFAALFAAWLIAWCTEAHDSGDVQPGVNADEPKAPNQWHTELPTPQPELMPLLPEPLPTMVNNSQMAAAQSWYEQQNRNALFTMEVARKNLRNAALLTVLNVQQVPQNPQA